MGEYKIYEGLTAAIEKQLTASDSYISNTVTVDNLLSTPSLLSMIIETSSKMLDGLIPKEYITVGRRLDMTHSHPTLIGETITLNLKVDKIEGNKVYLSFIGFDYKGEFCRGVYEKAIVDKNKLLENAIKRAKV